jgi:hypothetical protein
MQRRLYFRNSVHFNNSSFFLIPEITLSKASTYLQMSYLLCVSFTSCTRCLASYKQIGLINDFVSKQASASDVQTEHCHVHSLCMQHCKWGKKVVVPLLVK